MDLEGAQSALDWDDLPDGLVVVAGDGQICVANSAMRRITGRSPDELYGRHVDKALGLTDRNGRSWWECLQLHTGLAIRTGQPETIAVLPDGREVLVTARFVRPSAGGPVDRVVVSLRDTHARLRDERSQAELVSTVAHELRSPLTSVKGFTATLLAKWDRFTDEQKRLMLATVDADADRVTRLITDLLDIARIDSGRLVVRRQLLDLPAIVHRRVSGLVAGGHSEDRFSVDVVGELPEVWGDNDKVDQIVANLLENAVRHGAGAVSVAIRGGSAPETVVVTVADEGEGVPEHLEARIFTKFWHTERRGGTGLGLYIVRGLVEAHGGTVTVGRADGGGAVFSFTLPAGAPDFAR